MPLATSSPDLHANPVHKEPSRQQGTKKHANNYSATKGHGKWHPHCEQQFPEQAQVPGLPKEKGVLCLQVHDGFEAIEWAGARTKSKSQLHRNAYVKEGFSPPQGPVSELGMPFFCSPPSLQHIPRPFTESECFWKWHTNS